MQDNTIKRFIQKNSFINSIVIKNKERLRSVSYGEENPDKTFFVIRRNAPDAGLFSFVITNVGWMKYAIDRDYIPVVDMQSYNNTYIGEENIGKINSWEYYFRQPCGYGMKDISNSKNIIISSVNAAALNPNPIHEDEFKEWKSFADKYLGFSNEVVSETDMREKELFMGRRILGVLCRGTDYISMHPKDHPIQPDPSEVAQKAEKILAENNCDSLYLATEDESIYELFRRRFGTRLIVNTAKRYSNTGNRSINEIADMNVQKHDPDNRTDMRYRKGMDYAVTIALLARCKCLLAGQVSGTTGAMLLTEGFDYVFLYDIGLY